MPLDDVREEFNEHNLPLHLLLGLLSATGHLVQELEATHAPAAHTEPASNDRFLFLVLGLVSLHQTLHAQVDPLLSSAASPGERTQPATAVPMLRELLR